MGMSYLATNLPNNTEPSKHSAIASAIAEKGSRVFFVSTAHAAQEAVQRAAAGNSDISLNSLPLVKTVFDFDPIEHIRTITSEQMRTELLNSLGWSIDAHINVQLGKALTLYRTTTEAENIDAPLWESYSEFLHYVQAMEANDEILSDMGLDSPDIHGTLRRLYELRMQVHERLADGKHSYEIPDLEEFIANPRVRSVSATTYLKWQDLAEDEAEGDKELAAELVESLKLKAKAQALQSHAWDKERAKVLVTLLRAFKLDDMKKDVSYDGEYFPFDQLSPQLQHKLIAGMRSAMNRYIERASLDNRVEPLEFMKLRKERKPYLKTIDAALAHPRFADCA